MHHDLTFFSNDKNGTLLDRFGRILKGVKTLDILVGYFRASGFNLMEEPLGKCQKIQILVGIDTDKEVYDWFQKAKIQQNIDFETDEKTKEKAIEQILQGINNEEEYTQEGYKSVHTFIQYIREGRLEIRAYRKGKIHAKVYIVKYDEEVGTEYGKVITGSSNFSYSGLVGNREFNVELKNKVDVDFASGQFEELWKDGVEISEEFVSLVQTKTWLRDDITPYELYLKMLSEYFKEELNDDKDKWKGVPDGFFELRYQKDAVIEAERNIKKYGGTFLADVVGLGKTYIAAMLAKKIGGRNLIICPPVLIQHWETVLREFGVINFRVESRGMLEKIAEENIEYENVFLDESHYFRNQKTQAYALLHRVVAGANVICISATPQNNSPSDIESQLYLFQNKKDSSIEGIRDLETFFNKIYHNYKEAQKKDDDDEKSIHTPKAIKQNAKIIREQLLEKIMVRRTRKEIRNRYEDDFKRQGLKFPDITDPIRAFYRFDAELEKLFTENLAFIENFTFARYTPIKYIKEGVQLFSNTDMQVQKVSQVNLKGFMKTLLFKRLDSSFFAFFQTLLRLQEHYKKFINMYESQDFIAISKTVDVYDLLDNDNFEKIEEMVESGKIIKYPKKDLKPEYLEVLKNDQNTLTDFISRWEDYLYPRGYDKNAKYKIKIDLKLEKLFSLLETEKVLQKKLIIFTEAGETAEYLSRKLHKKFGDEVISFSGSSSDKEKEVIQRNFNPDNKVQKNDIRILITTDVLAEGISLHRSNAMINYDISWNPTKILQRVGRINRVGSKFDEIFLYNFFPTTTAETELGLEKNAVSKIQYFHHILGEDAKYLSEEEDLVSHELFNKLNSKEFLEGEDDGESERKYLEIIRKVRDDNPELFAKVQKLPQRSSSSRNYKNFSNSVLTFFQKGALKKFYISGSSNKEMSFLEAVKVFSCHVGCKKENLIQDFFNLVEKNKKAFIEGFYGKEEAMFSKEKVRRNSNKAFAMTAIQQVKNAEFLMEDLYNKKYTTGLLIFLEKGSENEQVLKDFKSQCEKANDVRIYLKVFQGLIPYSQIERILKKQKDREDAPSQVILSESITSS